jgi:hypothetical protein
MSTGPTDRDVTRRNFMGAAMVGLATVAAASSAPSAMADGAVPDAPPRPAGLKPHAMFDCRFPAAYETSVPAAMTVLTQYFSALAQRDLRAMSRCFHFPFAIYEGVEAIVVDSESNFLSSPPPSMNVSGTIPAGLQGRGGLTIRKGTYDMLDVLQMHTFNPVNVGLELVFSRYDADGEKLEVCQGIYGVTNNDGRWAIQLASTIYTPPGQMDVQYRDAVEHNLRAGRDWMLGWSESDGKLLGMRVSSPGKQASIGGGTGGDLTLNAPTRRVGAGGPGAEYFLGSAAADRPMDLYGAKGVKSRLEVRESRGERGLGETYTQQRFDDFDRLAAGQVGKYGYTRVLPNERVLHATVDKAHTFGGYVRYTPESVIISETRSLAIITYDHGQWGSAGGFGQSMYRDRSNDRL